MTEHNPSFWREVANKSRANAVEHYRHAHKVENWGTTDTRLEKGAKLPFAMVAGMLLGATSGAVLFISGLTRIVADRTKA
ncbi:MAG: hypothetical protein ACD_38C00191G0001 [uncultured bacterium]|nr:MAG: hypothetical protein ACD_38C00191G0001 [uncultured bacterium]